MSEQEWFFSLLVLDDHPSSREGVYADWRARGAIVAVETDAVRALARLRAGRFTLALLPLERRYGLRGGAGTAEEWVEDWAPNYSGRLVYYAQARGGREAEAEILLPSHPTPPEAARAAEMVGVAAERVSGRRKR